MAQLVVEHDLLVAADEIHADLTYAGATHHPLASLGPDVAARTFSLTSATKAFNLAGVRCAAGYCGSEALLDRYTRQLQPDDARGVAVRHRRDAGRLDRRATSGSTAVSPTSTATGSGSRPQSPNAFRRSAIACPTRRTSRGSMPAASRLECPPAEHFLHAGKVAFSDGAAFGAGGGGLRASEPRDVARHPRADRRPDGQLRTASQGIDNARRTGWDRSPLRPTVTRSRPSHCAMRRSSPASAVGDLGDVDSLFRERAWHQERLRLAIGLDVDAGRDRLAVQVGQHVVAVHTLRARACRSRCGSGSRRAARRARRRHTRLSNGVSSADALDLARQPEHRGGGRSCPSSRRRSYGTSTPSSTSSSIAARLFGMLSMK